jgi:hypothetical protein
MVVDDENGFPGHHFSLAPQAAHDIRASPDRRPARVLAYRGGGDALEHGLDSRTS